jgi:uncharacterized protein YbjT (DUF2867 family)/uncharacterized membrane protein
MRILVLGGYGLIGSAIVRRLVLDGHDVTGLGRSAKKGYAVSKTARWMSADLAKLTTPDRWKDLLSGFDAVVNAAGVLQSGLTDKVSSTQEYAIKALIKACETEGVTRFIQISAPGVDETSDTDFYRTKARADAALMESGLNWLIFRPGLVISAQAYGGTSLLRMLAAFPFIQPLIYPDIHIQTVSVEDVADAVSRALADEITGEIFDLVSPERTTLEGLVTRFRDWLGFAPAAFTLKLPKLLGAITAMIADVSGFLGWRSALRSTALKVLRRDVVGDGTAWERQTGHRLKSLEDTLNDIPSTAQERIYARSMLAFPLLLFTLSVFWIVSGVIGFISAEQAIAVLGNAFTPLLRDMFVYGGSVADIMIGLALIIRPWTRKAAIASILLCFGYLFASVVISPHLWADPLGPMVKVFPAMALALAVTALAETR